MGLEQAQERINSVFDVFAHHSRRYALRELHRQANPMPLGDLADELVVRENEMPLTMVPDEEVKQLYLSLYHIHIPALEEANLVRYDQTRDTVALDEQATEIEQYQEFLTVE